jgi:HK97 family phage major capsid protein/HK97 family phage prohead protease
MPLPKPRKGQSQDDFVSSCIAAAIDDSTFPNTADGRKQAAAACYSQWSEAHKKSDKPKGEYGDVEYADPGFQSDGKPRYPIDTPEHIRAAWNYIQHPKNREPYSAEQLSHIEGKIIAAWKRHIDSAGPPSAKSGDNGVIRKTHTTPGTGLEFVMSDATVDRFGDVVSADGWDLANFKRNPVALFNHAAGAPPIGIWENVRVKDGALRGHLKLAPEGTSPRIDEIRKLIEAGILRAVSVGFRPIESKPVQAKDGMIGELYVRSELVECSVVSIPANPNALAIAKSLQVSDDTIGLVFAEHGKEDETVKRRGTNGEHAKQKRKSERGRSMGPLAQRIKDAQDSIVELRDQLEKHLESVDDDNTDETQVATTEELTEKIATKEKALEALVKAEQHLAKKAVVAKETENDATDDSQIVVRSQRPFAVPAKKVTALDYLWRSLTVQFIHHCDKGRRSLVDVLKGTYGEDEPTMAILQRTITRAASLPATTTGSGWADTLATTVQGEFIQALTPFSIYPRLAAMGSTFSFGRAATISLPGRTAGNLGGGFVAQGAAIPVKAGAFTPITFTPKKMGVISVMTREITEHSIPAIEGIIRQGILEDTAVAIDTALMDNNASSSTRPEGLQHMGGAALGPTAAGGLTAFVGDLKLAIADLISNTNGNLRRPVWIMNPGDVLAASMLTTTTGDQPYRAELSGGTLFGHPVIQSTTGTNDTMYLMDAADFITVTGDTPRFDVSDQAVLHMEDTTPLAIASAGTPNTVAAPVRSLFQTDSTAIRMLLDINWGLRHAGTVSWITNLSWN